MGDRTRVLVTGVGGRSVGHQILHALLLTGHAYDITVVDADPFSFGLYQVEKRFVVPLSTSPNYINSIVGLVRSGRIRVVIPGTESELIVLAENRAQVEAEGCVVLINPTNVVQLCANKYILAKWLTAHGFGTPLTVTAAEWPRLAEEVGFPLVGKPAMNTGGSRNVGLLFDEAEVLSYLEETAGAEIMFQEYVDAPEDEYTVGVCIDRGGEVIDSIVLKRKLVGLSLGSRRVVDGRSYALSTGYSQGFVIDHPQIRAVCEQLVLALGMRGPANIQCRLVGDTVKVFEVHPRFSGTTSIRADVGFNEPDLLIRSFLFGEHTGRVNYRTNVAAIRAFQSCIVPLNELAAVAKVK